MTMTGSQILVEALIEAGVEIIFGFPGGAVIPLFDALMDYEPDKIKLILTRHEQGAAHAADGYARATGKVGVCMATSGPGATNLTTGIATANMDSVPIVAITGQVKTHLIGNDAFQEADVTGITRPISKHNYLVRDVRNLARVVKEAFYIASTGRPGPVVIDLPVDVTTATLEKIKVNSDVHLPGYKPRFEGNEYQCRKAAEAINNAERPILYTGGGIILSGASTELRELAKKANLPVTTTLMGLGAFPENDPRSLGMLGMHGTVYANYAIMDSDLVIAVGVRFDDRVTGRLDKFAPGAKVLHIDIDPASISKNIPVHIPVVGDCQDVLRKVLKHVKHRDRPHWFAKIDVWKKRHPLRYNSESARIKPQYVVEQIYEATKGDAIICTEVGQNQMWAAQFYTYTQPRTWISSGGLGTMGFGFPAAIGAQVGCPDKIVFDIAGDGSIQMNIQELATAVYNKLPVKVAILNNGYLGMVRQWQELFFNRRYAHTTLDGNPDFVKLAEAYGAVGILIEKKEDVRPTIDRALATDNVVVMDFRVEPEENVSPMVPAGEAINKIMMLA
ncbi:MAG: biosynthetic-type acetolactate synthase large subunit [Planctomycetes bacterium]|nr:biosynthetic-type acetolactate synthase large subunit [Planctomycetota bacterium]